MCQMYDEPGRIFATRGRPKIGWGLGTGTVGRRRRGDLCAITGPTVCLTASLQLFPETSAQVQPAPLGTCLPQNWRPHHRLVYGVGIFIFFILSPALAGTHRHP